MSFSINKPFASRYTIFNTIETTPMLLCNWTKNGKKIPSSSCSPSSQSAIMTSIRESLRKLFGSHSTILEYTKKYELSTYSSLDVQLVKAEVETNKLNQFLVEGSTAAGGDLLAVLGHVCKLTN